MAPENLVEIENIGQSENATAFFLATLTLLGSTSKHGAMEPFAEAFG